MSLDIAKTGEFVKYTATLAGAGFAYTQTALGKNDSFFGHEILWGLPSRQVLSWVMAVALLLFLAALIWALFVFSGSTGIANMQARLGTLESAREVENQRRALAGQATLGPSGIETGLGTDIAAYTGSVGVNATIHFWLGGLGFVLAGLLFIEDVFEIAPPPVLDCATPMVVGGTPVTLSHPCGASPREIFDSGRIVGP